MDDDHFNTEFDGAGERVSLDTKSKFTLSRFRKSKWTKAFLWIISFYSWFHT